MPRPGALFRHLQCWDVFHIVWSKLKLMDYDSMMMSKGDSNPLRSLLCLLLLFISNCIGLEGKHVSSWLSIWRLQKDRGHITCGNYPEQKSGRAIGHLAYVYLLYGYPYIELELGSGCLLVARS